MKKKLQNQEKEQKEIKTEAIVGEEQKKMSFLEKK